MIRLSTILASALLLAGCGGGGGSSSSDGGDSVTITGKVMDGYIRGAKVCLDENENETCDPGEPSTTSGTGGAYTLTLDENDDENAPLLAEVGADAVDEDTGNPVGQAYKMQRPSGSGNISPFTTMIQEQVQNGGITEEAAEAGLREQLGLSAGVDLQDDYVAKEETGEEYQVMHQMAMDMADLFQEGFNGQQGNGGFQQVTGTVNQQLPQLAEEAREEVENGDDDTGDAVAGSGTFNVPDTGQSSCYDSSGSTVPCANTGQDGEHQGNGPDYVNHGDGTTTDNVTGLMWRNSADTDGDGTTDVNDKKSQSDAASYCSALSYGGYDDWRLPSIKQMYSLIHFDGQDPSSYTGTDTSGLVPFVDTDAFDFAYGDQSAGERIIDAQWATTAIYTSLTYVLSATTGNETMFGVNLADGRIKGYPTSAGGSEKTFYVYCVRGNEAYGLNNFTDNGDDTVTDAATGLMWQQEDGGQTMDWDDAIASCEEATTGGYTDWRLPEAKELESIVDYDRSPDYTSSAAIDPLFGATSFTNEAGETDWGFYWTSTTHATAEGGDAAVYVAFGRAMGLAENQWRDVHGAGAQRSDPKTYPTGQALSLYDQVETASGGTALSHGPQGDVIRVYNYVRCVRDAE